MEKKKNDARPLRDIADSVGKVAVDTLNHLVKNTDDWEECAFAALLAARMAGALAAQFDDEDDASVKARIEEMIVYVMNVRVSLVSPKTH